MSAVSATFCPNNIYFPLHPYEQILIFLKATKGITKNTGLLTLPGIHSR